MEWFSKLTKSTLASAWFVFRLEASFRPHANTTSKCSLSVWFEGLWCVGFDFISFQGLDLEETPSPVQTARVEEDVC